MSRHLKTFLLALAAFLGGLIATILVVYAVWYINSWDYLHAPNPSGEVRDAPAYVLLGAEMFIGLPVGLLAGIAAAVFVILRRRRGADRALSQSRKP